MGSKKRTVKRKLSNEITSEISDKSKSQAKNYQIAAALKLVRKKLAEEAVAVALGIQNEAPILKSLLSEADAALDDLHKTHKAMFIKK